MSDRRFDAALSGDAAVLARTHRELLDRLPATVHASLLVELQKWPTLFAPEQAYQRALLQHLAGLARPDLDRIVAGVSRVEREAGCHTLEAANPGRFQDDAQALLRTRRLLPAWRKEIETLFQQIDPAIEAQLYPPDAPRRLVVQLYGSGIAIQQDKLWSRFQGTGVRIPLKLDGARNPEAFLRTLFAGAAAGADRAPAAPTLFAAASATAGFTPLDSWIVECGEALSTLCEAVPAAKPGDGLTGLSYDRLRGYRDELTRALYKKVQDGVASPQEFAAYARSLTIAPGPGVRLYQADVMQAFVRDVLLTGNGTLFVNNTFVEWAAVQALKRAQPRLLVTRYGVRDKMKPFSSLLLFSQPRESDQIPMIEDPVGSFVDVEQLSYYVWLNAEKTPAYRRRTLYLFLAEGVDEMLAIRSDKADTGTPPQSVPAATLADIHATMAHWLRVPTSTPAGRPVDWLS